MRKLFCHLFEGADFRGGIAGEIKNRGADAGNALRGNL